MSRESVERHFDDLALRDDYWKRKNAYYYSTIKAFVSRIVSPGSSVLDVGCGTGEILAATEPSRGVGVDLSGKMIELARQKHSQHTFIHSPVEDLELNETFDYIIMVDVLDHAYDLMKVFQRLSRFCKPTTRIILTTGNPWWEPVYSLLEKIGAKMPKGPHNAIEKGNLRQIFQMMDLKINYSGFMLLFPRWIPVLSYLANSLGVRIWGINRLSAIQYMIVQPTAKNENNLGLGCSVIIPCYNEQDNIEQAIRRVPSMGACTEIIAVSDGCTDGTVQKVKDLQREIKNLKLIEYSPNRGKGHAVRKGFEAATQDVLMILDADISTPPEELPWFFAPLNKGICQFVNGTRMVYPMQAQAMRTLNLFGNKLFGYIVSFIMQQSLTDTLCGTKAFYRKDLPRLRWGTDKWGDFDLLFGAARMGSKIMEVPVHYMTRKTGESKMRSFRHGVHLLMACVKGFHWMIFIPRRDFYYKWDVR